MALTERKCDACAQCFLNITGGVCPIVDCSKSLVNGQCGGAKNGKCEVDGDKDCALGHLRLLHERRIGCEGDDEGGDTGACDGGDAGKVEDGACRRGRAGGCEGGR